MADVDIADPEADHEPGHRQNGARRDNRRKALVDSLLHGRLLVFRLLQCLIAVHNDDRVVDRGTHLDGRHNHVRDKGRDQPLEIGNRKIDPDTALDHKGQQHRARKRPERKEQDNKDKCNGQNRDLPGIARIGSGQVSRAGDLADDQDIAFSVILFGGAADGIHEIRAFLALDRDVRGKNHAAVIPAPQLVRSPLELTSQIRDFLLLGRVQRDDALVDFLEQIFEHIEQGHSVFVRISEKDLILLIFDPVPLKKKKCRLIIQVQQFREHSRSKCIRQHMAFPRLDIGESRRALDMIQPRNSVQNRLLVFIGAGGHNQGNHGRIGKRVRDFVHGLPGRGIDYLRNRTVGECILRLLRILYREGQDQNKHPEEAEFRLRQEPSPGPDARNMVAVRSLLKLPRKEHDQAGHKQKYRDQAAKNALREDDAHVIAQAELHQRQRHEPGDRGKARRRNLDNGLGERFDQRLPDHRVLLHLILIAVYKNDRVVDGQRQLQDDRDGIRDGRNLSQKVVGPHIHKGRHRKHDDENHDLEITPRRKEQHGENHRDRDGQHAAHFPCQLFGVVVADLGRDIGVIVRQELPDMIHFRDDVRICLLSVKGNREQRGRIDEMHGRIVQHHLGHMLEIPDLRRQLFGDLIGNIRDHHVG